MDRVCQRRRIQLHRPPFATPFLLCKPLFFDVGRYEGDFEEDKRHGEGTLILAGGGR